MHMCVQLSVDASTTVTSDAIVKATSSFMRLTLIYPAKLRNNMVASQITRRSLIEKHV
jgi:hypothetical protein